ncbi:hypothetical protein ATX30_02555 [Oenococcus oeni]|nr:hypothetical protein ATX30_02555 [Oenococcus oeni]
MVFLFATKEGIKIFKESRELKMKAAVVREKNDGFVDLIDDWKPRELGFGDALVDVEYCGLCHTDLHQAEILAIQIL